MSLLDALHDMFGLHGLNEQETLAAIEKYDAKLWRDIASLAEEVQRLRAEIKADNL